jgi:hypothetical protein
MNHGIGCPYASITFCELHHIAKQATKDTTRVVMVVGAPKAHPPFCLATLSRRCRLRGMANQQSSY